MSNVFADLHAALAYQRELAGRFVPRVDVPVDDAPVAPPPVALAREGGAGTAETTHRVVSAEGTAGAVPATSAHDSSAAHSLHPPPVENAAEPAAASSVGTETPDDPMSTISLFGDDVPAPEPPVPASPYARIEALIPEGHPVKACSTLAEVEHVARTTVFIPLDETRQNPVFGVGNPHADLMIIGEAPGADEDRTGEPFVGRAGQLLTKILAAIGFQREDVYIANILKSRPPGNRDPEPEEIAAHVPMLYKQIALVQPKVLLCVGKTSGNALLGKRSSLAGLRDRAHDFHGLPLFVTYHPAALLRNEQWKRPTWEDVQLMKAAYDRATANDA